MGTVSIVIPTYNTELYLRDCLRSLQAQSYQDLQVIVVDDESTDASPYIAQQFAAEDSRFRHVRQANRGPGPGGGRNGGLPYVEGDWIFFLDADDLVPEDAIERLVEVGRQTGSDIVTGHVSRFRGQGKPWPTPNHSRSHSKNVEKTQLLRYPTLAWDTTAWNKLYRTEFWNGAGRRFPEQKLFEDIAPITKAHCESQSTDIITDCVLLWRIREDHSSITQQVADTRTFADKIEQMTIAHQFLCDHASEAVRLQFEEKSLTRDFQQGVEEVRWGDDDYVSLLTNEGCAFLDRMLPESLDRLRPRDQLMFHLLADHRVDDLRDLTKGAYEKSSVTIVPSDVDGPAVVNDFAARLDPPVPVDLQVADGWPPLRLGRVFIDWGDDDCLVIRGTASIPQLGDHWNRLDSLYVRARQPHVHFDVKPLMHSPFSDGWRGLVDRLLVDRKNRRVRFAPFGRFEARIPLSDLTLNPGATETEWRFSIGGSCRGVHRRVPLPRLNPGRLPERSAVTTNGLAYELSVTQHVNLTVRVPNWSSDDDRVV